MTFNVGSVVRNLRIYIWKDNIVKVRLNFVFMRDGVHICTCIHVKTRGQPWLHSSDPVYFIYPFPLDWSRAHIGLAGLAGQQLPGIPLPLCPSQTQCGRVCKCMPP